MSSNYYKKLYLFQDEVLNYIKGLNTPFYLTGGTVLSRFFLHHRYSDDLDLFARFDPDFEKYVDKITTYLKKIYGEALKTQIDQDYFKRFFINDPSGGIELKLEFINDVAYHKGNLWSNQIYDKIDSWQNILSNKICALSRNDERDLVDLLFLSYKYEFNWIEMIDDARQKDDWVEEIKVSKYLYDVNILSGIKFMDEKSDWSKLIPDFKIMARDLLKGSDNTLVRPGISEKELAIGN